MRKIIAVHFGAQPAFTAQENHPDAERFQFGEIWVDATGGQPTQAEIDAVTAPGVPRAVTMRQARLALLGAGLLTAVNDAVAAMPGAAGEAARIEWEYSQEVQRDKALVAALAPVLGFDDAQLDALFTAAAAL